MNRSILIVSLILSTGEVSRAAEPDGARARLNATLAARVLEGRVDYAGLKKDSSGLDAWLAAAAAADEDEFKGRPRDQRLAFLINLYNAATLRLILDRYPIASIRDIGPAWDPNKAWKLPAVKAFGRTVTLNQLEHEMIRPVYNEPRVHFALVCAAKGCPPLRSESYDGTRLDAQLDDQARTFLSQRAKNDASKAGETAYLSPIFKWYMKDFGGSKKAVLRYVKKWLPVEEGWAVDWTAYDWALNEDKK
ncbi:MAG: DUF547 domain-containing protein [Elusimicrobia bacterium]|nr:DUF547 domain-containing protein [Elusimicrobiota bacterium]